MKVIYTKHSEQKSNESVLSHTHPLKQQCTKFLSRHHPVTPRQWLVKMAESEYSRYQTDFYGEGELIQRLEQRIATLLDKPNALFCHKGMVGQLSAIKHWSRQNSANPIAFQPDCHMDFDEQDAYRELLDLQAIHIGNNQRPLLAGDFPLEQEVSVISIELPHRRAGFLLPEWQTLQTLHQKCKDASIPLHFDGARLFEASAYWQKSPAEVCALCDSVYVSLYKMFGALAGGIIAADEATIEAIRPWKSRMGGDVHTLFPYSISAMIGLDEYLPRIQEFSQQAMYLASIITKTVGEDALPHTPQTNSFVVYLPLSPAETTKRVLSIAKAKQIWLFDTVSNAPNGKSKVEIQIGDAFGQWTNKEIHDCFELLCD